MTNLKIMFYCKNNLKLFTQSKYICQTISNNRNSLSSSIRLYSSFNNGKGHNDENHTQTNTEEDEKIKNDPQEPFVTKSSPSPSSNTNSGLSFMPVINIPQTEFAHNAFFSLHRPLLGLSSEDEKPFFSNQPIEEESDEQLANYMANVKPFEAPQPPGMADEVEDKKNDSSYSISFSTGDAMLPDEEIYLEQTLPMYYMPESDEIVDYLSTIQEKLVRQNALYNNNNEDGVGSVGRTKRYTTATSNTTRNKDGIITRYHKRQQQGIYRHRWNK